MNIFNIILTILWLILVCYWVITAFKAKRSITNRLGHEILIRILFIIVFIFIISALRSTDLDKIHFLQFLKTNELYTVSIIRGIIGIVICALGIAIAIWARYCLGTNWGMPRTLRATPELVTTGPYRYIRHPIYTGFMLAMIGTTIINGIIWFIPLAFFSVYFIYSGYIEERDVEHIFPQQYPLYKAQTKMFIPFIW